MSKPRWQNFKIKTFLFYPLFNPHVHPIWQNNQLVDGGHYQAEAEEAER
jgi:hypothetical protein